MSDTILQTFPLGFQWPTIDPFLFCVHHLDAYPVGDGAMRPQASLAGREIGSDFEGIDGWRMYHGSDVPGFPQHPHRGFETVTYVRTGVVDHSDSLGATARFGGGDVQWLTAGRGIVHSEMFPMVNDDAPNPLELFQIWVNLASDDKMADPHFSMLWNVDIPRWSDGAGAEVTVIAGSFAGLTPPPPPPRSWAARPAADLAIWHVRLASGSTVTLPPATQPDAVRVLYLFEGAGADIDGEAIGSSTGAVVRCDADAVLTATVGDVEMLMLQGRPIGEPVAQYGPFVMNTKAEIQQAFEDYQRTGFGGWPWASDGPVHPADVDRFATTP